MDKNTILNQVSEQDIFLKFLNLSEFPKNNISSPFSEDKNESFKLYKNNSFKCHSTGKQGDVWQFVADLHNLNCKSEFNKVLSIVAEKMGIDNTQKHFAYTKKEYTQTHLNWWFQGNWAVTKDFLEKFKVYPLDKFEFFSTKTNSIEKKKIFNGVLAFVYEVNENAEIYIPKQEKTHKFNLNKTFGHDIFGLAQIPELSNTILICAGKKDALIANANGFSAVSFRSENHNPTETQIQDLRSKCANLCVCYDNDSAGQMAQEKLVQKFKLIPVHLPQEFNDLADYFLIKNKGDFQKIVTEAIEINQKKEAKDDSEHTIFHTTINYLLKFYEFRYNEIALDIEVRKKGLAKWDSLNENSLFLELQMKGIKIGMANLLAILKSDFVPFYNPIKEYFNNLPKWDQKTDYISLLSSFVKPIDRNQFEYHFKKWLVRTVKCATISDYFNKQAFILVHRGQNTGKSTFCRFICPPTLSNYIAEDITQDKDARILLCKNFLINLDELAGLNKKELTSLKSIFSKTQINERLPYDRKNSILPRICSFIGSTNEDNFLNDDTGSVRWLCFQITHIDWKYKERINIDLVWSQAFHLAKDTSFDCEMSLDDIKTNEDRNSKFQQLSTEQEILATYLEKTEIENGQFFTASDILLYLIPLGIKLNKIQIGKAMGSLGYVRDKHKTRQVYGYWLNPLPLDVVGAPKSFDAVLKAFS
jgi:predicted P-loop ATPase